MGRGDRNVFAPTLATALAVLAGVMLALAPTASAGTGCAALSASQARDALGSVFRLQLQERPLGSVRDCTISVVRAAKPKLQPYVTIRDWPSGGGKKAFDYTSTTLRKRGQKTFTFVSFGSLPGLGQKAYRSEVLVKGHPRRSILVWTGSNFIHAFNEADTVSFAQLTALTRAALGRL